MNENMNRCWEIGEREGGREGGGGRKILIVPWCIMIHATMTDVVISRNNHIYIL